MCLRRLATEDTHLAAGSRLWGEYGQDQTDVYGRGLLYAWNSRGIFVNEALASEGLAGVEVIPPTDARERQLRAAEQRAMAAKVRLHDEWIASSQLLGHRQ